jgi:hypothetical protein
MRYELYNLRRVAVEEARHDDVLRHRIAGNIIRADAALSYHKEASDE